MTHCSMKSQGMSSVRPPWTKNGPIHRGTPFRCRSAHSLPHFVRASALHQPFYGTACRQRLDLRREEVKRRGFQMQFSCITRRHPRQAPVEDLAKMPRESGWGRSHPRSLQDTGRSNADASPPEVPRGTGQREGRGDCRGRCPSMIPGNVRTASADLPPPGLAEGMGVAHPLPLRDSPAAACVGRGFQRSGTARAIDALGVRPAGTPAGPAARRRRSRRLALPGGTGRMRAQRPTAPVLRILG
jgi:hypothetical protein